MYAENLACIIGENSRIALETSARKVIEALNKWCNYHRLNTSASKTVALMIKESMNKSRLPIIKINDQNIKYVGQHKYLRIIVDRRFTFIVHARYLRSKVTQFVMAIRRIAEKWRLKTDMLKTLYRAAAFPIIRYGSLLWYDVANKTLIKRNLLAL